MTKTIQAKTLAQISYTFTETTTNQRTITDSDSYQNASSYTYGTGNFQATSVAKATGVLASGGSLNVDTTAFTVDTLGTSYDVNFTGVKSIVVQNTSTVQGYDVNILATGANALTEIFNGGSGNIVIKPYSSYVFNDPYTGAVSDGSNKNFQISDGGSGANYSITILGLI